MAVGIGCLIKDTKIVKAIREILEAEAAYYISNNRKYSFSTAYSTMSENGVEVDLESVAAIYSDMFDLSEDSFTSLDSIERIVGRKFDKTLDMIASVRPFTGIRKIGDMSPGKAAANQIALLFDEGMKFDEGTSSVMRVFQEKMKAAAERYLDKTVFPSEGDKATRIKQIEELLEGKTLSNKDQDRYEIILKRLKGKQSFLDTLNEAFSFNEKGYERTEGDGGFNTILDVSAEFKKEIQKYTDELKAKLEREKKVEPQNEQSLETQKELELAVKSFEKYTEILMDKVIELYLSESEVTDSIKQILVSQGFGRKVNDKKGNLSREIIKLDKLYAKASDDIARAEIESRRTVAKAEFESIEKAETDLSKAEKEVAKLDPLSADYENEAASLREQIFRLQNYLDNINKALDWKKLTFVTGVVVNESGDVVKNEGIEALKYHISRVLRNTGFEKEKVDIIQRMFERDYLRLKEDIQEKMLSELIRKNEVKPLKTTGTETRRMAQLHSLGWFDEHPDTYEKIVRDALGVNRVDAATFERLKVLSRQLSVLFEPGQSDQNAKTAINKVNQEISDILQSYEKDQETLFKLSHWIVELLMWSMRAMLTSISNALQNTVSGKYAIAQERIVRQREGNTNEKTKQNDYNGEGNVTDRDSFLKEISSAIFNDIWLDKGLGYGDVQSTFVFRSSMDRIIDDKVTNRGWRGLANVVSGKAYLDAMDSMYKFTLTHGFFINNLTTILTNHLGYDKDGAIAEISSKLYGYSFDDAIVNARNLIAKVEADSRVKMDMSENAIKRLAADLVKMNLMEIESKIEGKKNLSEDLILMAYKSAYETAGYRIGHVPNNIISKYVQTYGADLTKKLRAASKNGNNLEAARLKLIQGVNTSFISPFGNGGTNWVVIMLESIGGGMLRALPYYVAKKILKKERSFGGITVMGKTVGKVKISPVKQIADFDISDPDEIRQMEKAITRDRQRKIQMTRGVIGFAAHVLVSLALYALWLDGDDDEEKMADFDRRFNELKPIRKYLSTIPAAGLYVMNFFYNNNIDYVMQMLNLRFQDFETSSLISEALKLWGKGETAEMKGKLGELAGSFARAPIPSYRVFRNLDEASVFFLNTDPNLNPDYGRSIGFWNGFFKFGLVNDLGRRPGVKHDLSSLPGVGGATMKSLKDIGISDIDKLKEHLMANYPDRSFQEALGALKKIREDGTKTAMFTKENIAQIEEIISNDNRAPLMKMDDIFKDKEQLKLIKKKKIYTVPQLNDAILNGNLFNDPALNLTDEQIQNILQKVENYYEKIEK